MSEVTDWICRNPEPDRPGWYEVRFGGFLWCVQRRWWDGSRWWQRPGGSPSMYSTACGDQFRGLAKPTPLRDVFVD
jgi:hypothetical protein